MTAKKPAADRRAQILQAAIKLAAKHGYMNITRDQIATECELSAGLINKYFSTMTQLKRDVMRHVVKECNLHIAHARLSSHALAVLAQGIAMRDRHALRASEAVRSAALAVL